MKKLWRISFIYFFAAIACGVFYREYTKYTNFTGKTTLAFTHLHLLVLGTLLFMILLLFSIHTKLTEVKNFKVFLVLYNIGLPMMVVMLFIRGITQVQTLQLSKGASAAISGAAGISHLILTAAFIVLFLALKQVVSDIERR